MSVIPMRVSPRVDDPPLYIDACDWAVHRLIDISADYQKAIAEATSPGRCNQLAERLGEIIKELERIQGAARVKADFGF